MGGLAGAAGAARLTEPRWLIGGNAALAVAADGPTLWLIDLDDAATRERIEAVALLPGEAETFASRGDAGLRLLRRRAARLLLAASGGIRVDQVVIERSAAGMPLVVVPLGWDVSVAARWPACVVGVAPMPLGVDLERIERDLAPEPDLLTARERDRLDMIAADDRARFFARAWAAKESHAKLTGKPREVAPALVETEEARVTSPWGNTRCWRYEAGDLVAAVCTGG